MKFLEKMTPPGIILVSLLLTIGFAMAEQNSAAKQDPPTVQSKHFDDWYHRCAQLKTAGGKPVPQFEVAQITQVKQGEKNVNVLTLAIVQTTPEAAKRPSGNELLLTTAVTLKWSSYARKDHLAHVTPKNSELLSERFGELRRYAAIDDGRVFAHTRFGIQDGGVSVRAAGTRLAAAI